jgi:hypothetical protein
VVDRPGALEVIEEDRFDVEGQFDLVPDGHAVAGKFVLAGDAEVVPVDAGGRLEPDRAISPLFSSPSRQGVLPSPM